MHGYCPTAIRGSRSFFVAFAINVVALFARLRLVVTHEFDLLLTERELEPTTGREVLKAQGIKSGDRVAIYMPMIPEAVVAMLACMRVGAAHTIVFGGFSSEALSDFWAVSCS